MNSENLSFKIKYAQSILCIMYCTLFMPCVIIMAAKILNTVHFIDIHNTSMLFCFFVRFQRALRFIV